MQALAGRVAGGDDPERAGRRAPARPRHVRPARRWRARRRPTPRCRPRCARARSPASTSRWSRAARRRGAARSTRRSAATGACARGSPPTPTIRATRSRTSRSSARCPTTRCCGCGWRPAARTRSARTCWRSAIPCAGDPEYGAPGRYGLARQFLHAARLAFAHPGHRRSRSSRSTLRRTCRRDLARSGPAGSALPARKANRPTGGRGREAGPLQAPTQARRRTCSNALSSARLPDACSPSAEPRGGGPDATRGRGPCPARSAGSALTSIARAARTKSPREITRGPGRNQGAAGGRSALRPPDAPLEPQDAPLHPRRERRHLHHRPAQDAGAARSRRSGSRPRSPTAAARCCSSAPRSRRATASRRSPRRPACRTSTTAGSAAC